MSLFQTFQVLFVCGLFTRTIQPKFSFFKLAVTRISNAAPTPTNKSYRILVQSQLIQTWQRHCMLVTSDSSRLCRALPLLYVEEIYRLLMGLDRHVAAVAARLWRPPGPTYYCSAFFYQQMYLIMVAINNLVWKCFWSKSAGEAPTYFL